MVSAEDYRTVLLSALKGTVERVVVVDGIADESIMPQLDDLLTALPIVLENTFGKRIGESDIKDS